MELLVAVAFGVGVLLVYLGLTAPVRDPEAAPPQARPGRLTGAIDELIVAAGATRVRARDVVAGSVATAAVAGVFTMVSLGWPVMALTAAVVGGALPAWYLRGRADRRRQRLEEAIPEAVGILYDAVRSGRGIEEAQAILATGGPPELRATFARLVDEATRTNLEQAWLRAADEVADRNFDTIAMAVVFGHRTGGAHLGTVLEHVGASVTAYAQTRREVRAIQAQNVFNARVIALMPLAYLGAIRLMNSAFLESFTRPAGQVVLAGCVLSIAAGYVLMLRAASVPEGRRVLTRTERWAER